MQLLQTSNTNALKKEMLKEIRHLHCQIQGRYEVPAGCWVVRNLIPFPWYNSEGLNMNPIFQMRKLRLKAGGYSVCTHSSLRAGWGVSLGLRN